MPKRKTKPSARSPRNLILLAASALALFLLGEAFLLARSDSGRLTAARLFGIGDAARLTQLVGKQMRRALPAIDVSPDSLTETAVENGPAPVRWRMGLSPQASLLKANYVLSRFAEMAGAQVLSGRERVGAHGETIVTLLIGLPRRPTHQVVLVRGPRPAEDLSQHVTRLAIVVYGLGDDLELATGFCALPVPFAVAVVPGGKSSAAMFRIVHDARREVVMHLPLEPINYPSVDPGPGTVLVTMRPTQIAGLVQRHLDQARPLTAVANHMGTLATQDMTVMSAVYHVLRRAGLPFIHVNPVAGAVCKPLAADAGVAYDEPDEVIDYEARQERPAALNQRWQAIVKEARGRDRMMVWLRATPLTRQWLTGAVDRKQLEGVYLVPLSAVVRVPSGI